MQNGRQSDAMGREGNAMPALDDRRYTDVNSGSRLVLDDTTIYEIDLDCYQCMTEQERREAGLE